MRTGKRIVAGAIGVAVVALVLGACSGETASTAGEPASSDTGPSASPPEVPEVDFVLDLDSGVMTPLPEAIIESVFRSKLESDPGPSISMRYAASPDGSRLAYVGVGEDGSPEIFTARIDGTEIRQMTHGRVFPESPAWSPDGRRIAYAGYGADEDRARLFVLEVATGRASAQIARNASWPQFTPDGSAIVYSGGRELRIVPVEGGESRPLFRPQERGLQDAFMGSVSPDGSLVTFFACRANESCPKRYVANVDGTDLRLLPGGWSNPAGTWSPDGSRIVVEGGIVVDVAKGEAPVAPFVDGAGGAIWLDDQTLLIEVL